MESLLIFSLYMLYGLVFMAIGFAIYFRDLRFSHLDFAKALPTLALFGFIHGLHEWADLYLYIYNTHFYLSDTVQVLKVTKLWVSFAALGYFALQMLKMTQWHFRHQLKYLIEVLIVLFFISLIYRYNEHSLFEFLDKTVIQTRWFFGSGAGLLAGTALINYSRQLQKEEREAAHTVSYLGVSIIIYGLFAGLFFVENPVLGPIIRLACAFPMLYFLRKTLVIFDNERLHQIEKKLMQSMHDHKLRDMGELISGVAHEVKTPLSSTLMRCDLLERKLNDGNIEKAKIQLEYIRKGVLKAAHISQTLLEFSHKKPSNKRSVLLSDIINDSVALMSSRLQGFDLNISIPEESVAFVDKEQIEEVVINILNNAIDASEDNKVIKIKAHQKGLKTIMSIRDEGTGIADNIVDKISRPFFTTKDKQSGTGLGLSLCKTILEQNSGTLKIYNTHTGVCVDIELPTEYK